MACLNQHGVVLAADGRAVDFDPSGEMTQLKVKRLTSLSEYTAIIAGGAVDGVEMCQALKDFIRDEGINDVREVYNATLPFLATEFEKFMRKKCEVLPLDPIHHVYFILGGYTEQDPNRPYRLYLLWTKKKLPRLDGDEISAAFTAPRIMGLEYRLNRLSQENTPLDTIFSEIKRSMELQSQKSDEIGPPFSYALITRDGFREVSF
jgi:hypothetical protein